MKNNKKELGEVKSLRWLANQFPFVENATDDVDKMCNAIHLYTSAGANKIEELVKLVEDLKCKNNELEHILEELCNND